MNLWIILLGIITLGVIIWLSTLTGKKDKRRRYLEALADYVESRLEPLEGYPNSFRIRCNFAGNEFVYEDIVDRAPGNVANRVFLKGPSPTTLTLSLTEKPRTTIRADVQSFADMKTPWVNAAEKLVLPPELKMFSAFTNDPLLAGLLLEDGKVLKAFVSCKNVDALGHPVCSLEIKEGTVIMGFHPRTEMKPSLAELYHSPPVIADYLERAAAPVERLKKLAVLKKERGQL
ncbi:MAG: hypothetical protein Q8Q08_05775 [Candidatus Omnitrophota bacterium]|nr:hypothetical protein [Candidatus Omnitrophota bacterium]MDZ4242772.1 hypothetical protein [Candidatus Omnitrophota bacterium]